MKVFALNYETNCDHEGCKEKAVGLFGDLTLCQVHIDEYQKIPMSKEDRQEWARINNERMGIYPGDFEGDESFPDDSDYAWMQRF